jgi:hypothetical protein
VAFFLINQVSKLDLAYGFLVGNLDLGNFLADLDQWNRGKVAGQVI